jgi:hypothetical protein
MRLFQRFLDDPAFMVSRRAVRLPRLVRVMGTLDTPEPLGLGQHLLALLVPAASRRR